MGAAAEGFVGRTGQQGVDCLIGAVGPTGEGFVRVPRKNGVGQLIQADGDIERVPLQTATSAA